MNCHRRIYDLGKAPSDETTGGPPLSFGFNMSLWVKSFGQKLWL